MALYIKRPILDVERCRVSMVHVYFSIAVVTRCPVPSVKVVGCVLLKVRVRKLTEISCVTCHCN